MRRLRRQFSAGEREELWQRWRSGQSVSEIARGLERPQCSVWQLVGRHGGIAPLPRQRSRLSLSSIEREEISRGLSAGLSLRSIAKTIGRSPSTVTREIARNGDRACYRAGRADKQAWDRAERPKRCKLSRHRQLRMLVAGKLEQEWAPQQISGWLKLEFPGNAEMQVSHETIYRTLFIQARGALKKELVSHLRRQRVMRKSSKLTKLNNGGISDAVSIRERPAEVEDRAVPGHWEGDLIVGSNDTYIATLVERQTRYVMLARVPTKSTETVVRALTKQILKLPTELRQSLTWDRGTEMVGHKDFTVATDVQVYFCDPQSPWQRGSNENTNGLLRQYFPKSTDLSVHSQVHLDKIARRLNERPRETLGFRTPAYKLAEVLR